MNRDTMLIIIASLIFLVIVTYVSEKKQQTMLIENKVALDILRIEAEEIDTLKKKWRDKDLANKLLSQMKNQKLIKDERSANNIIFEFQNLQKDEVDNITNTLFNSTLKIQELTILKSSEFNATIGLKVSI